MCVVNTYAKNAREHRFPSLSHVTAKLLQTGGASLCEKNARSRMKDFDHILGDAQATHDAERGIVADERANMICA